MLTNGKNGNKIKAKFIGEDKYGFVKGKIYDGFIPKTQIKGINLISIVDDYGEEYGYPASWFEIVEE